MGKFNTKSTMTKKLKADPSATLNHEGGLAFELEAKTKLATQVLSTFVEPKFYSDRNQVEQELRNSVVSVAMKDPEFVLKLAAYARNVMNLRSVPMFILNEFANNGFSAPDSRKYVTACIQRVDDITELLGLSIHSRLHDPAKRFKTKKASMLILKGVSPAFNKFDEYQFGKYNRDGEVKLKDALFMAHPVPKDKEQQALFDKIATDSLATPETWEVAISGKGASKESWEAIIPKMGYMALLRNLQNFLKHGVNIEPVLNILKNPVAIKKSRQYPFRFYSAYKALNNNTDHKSVEDKYKALNALESAISTSIENFPKIPGKSLVLVDVSGSMSWQNISAKSSVTPADIAGLFGAMASTICESSDVIVFATDFGRVRLNNSMGVLEKMTEISRANVGGGTEAHRPMAHARTNKQKYDRIFLFSDMQCYEHSRSNINSFAREFVLYQTEVNKDAYLYSFDLTGYGTSVVPEHNKNVLLLAGFSEKLFEFIPAFETERETLVQKIEDYKV